MVGMPREYCPFYAPYVKYGNCRYCGCIPSSHRKYFIYSYNARIIQKVFLRFMFLKRTKVLSNVRLNLRDNSILQVLVLRFIYKNPYHHKCDDIKFYTLLNHNK